jgi:hypothetical protein
VAPSHVRAALDALPNGNLVLDVGGWARADPRADWVIDIGAYETRNYYAHRLGGAPPVVSERFTRETWVQMDICTTPWPFKDAMFDYAICTQTLEDVRDPIGICVEMMRVAKAGYIETPPAAIELTRGVQSPDFCGWQHHRWMVEQVEGGLVFIAKPHHIHSPLWPAIRSPRFLIAGASEALQFEWKGSFPVREEIRIDAADIDRELRRIIDSATRPDPLGTAIRRGRQGATTLYRAARRSVAKLRRV